MPWYGPCDQEEEEKMSESKVLEFLRCPASELVDLAMEMANLTWKESLAITLCGRQAKTQFKAAEESGYSEDAMQKWYRSGMNKLIKLWSGVWWIQKVVE